MFLVVMSNLVELFGCVRLLFRKEEEEMTFLDRRLDVCCLDGCDFGVVCYCC